MRITIMTITAIAFVSSSLIVAGEVIETGEITRLAMWLAGISFVAWLALVIQIGGMAAVRGRSVCCGFSCLCKCVAGMGATGSLASNRSRRGNIQTTARQTVD